MTVQSQAECDAQWGPDGAVIISSHVCARGTDTTQGTGTCNVGYIWYNRIVL